ncbi:MAG: radical SAM family heme chaperone HemW [Candidatus Omnitrophica bacterium]|nr:radical SAM family heme chaperone HemW [Candidatus Omnitrophota bacterium]
MSSSSLYIHIPFCGKKCLFCSFSVAVNQANYVNAYLKALRQEALRYQGTRLSTLYIGGGTPSFLSEEQIDALFVLVSEQFMREDGCEVTFECNPESVTESKARLLRRCGVTRVSLGIQSMRDRILTSLGRAHSQEDAERAFSFLRSAGHENISVDFMYGMEGQSHEDIDQDLADMIRLGSEHVSIYALTVEERSLLFVRKGQTPGAGDADLYEGICSFLENAGISQYEISNFSRASFESRHNINYWQGGEYIGLGMAAHSHVAGRRFWNQDTLSKYLNAISQEGHAVVGEERLTPKDKMIEVLLFSLRMNRGINLDDLQKRFHADIPPEKIEVMESFIEMGLLEEDGMVLRTTVRGRSVLDEISARLV